MSQDHYCGPLVNVGTPGPIDHAPDALEAAYEANTTHTVEDGRHSIQCKKGLFGISAPTLREATQEALPYFKQYYADGEYGRDNE